MKLKLLFVCLGNICRSPSAEAVMKDIVGKEGLSGVIEIDSAGIIGTHAGESADSRMKVHAAKRGYNITSISRQIQSPIDFDVFDYIIGMDDTNILSLEQFAKTPKQKAKIFKITDFCKDCNYNSVPDPYYGGADGFELVLDILEQSCADLLTFLKEKHSF